MELSKKAIALFLMLMIIVNFSIFGVVQALAHETILNVEYDYCSKAYQTDGIDEKWYVLYTRRTSSSNSKCYHISHETQTIKYYFADESPTGYRWDTDITEEMAEEIKTCYANSMKKWNNVYFYSYDSAGNIIKQKVINIVEGNPTDSDCNLIIYPGTNTGNYAGTRYDEAYGETIENNEFNHYHVSDWWMIVNVSEFYTNNPLYESKVNVLRARTGAHEIGHILGLRDLDNNSLCGGGTPDEHHEELLMGYGVTTLMATDITYKDIAGVAITRGFHTDADHKWLYAGQQSDGTYKLICSICNGVKYVESLSGYSYNTYNACNGNHTLSSGNMMAVASYGTSDYYKCRYCRYVAPFSDIVEQNYSKIYVSDEQHKCESDVDGLEYTFYEPHSFTYGDITSAYHAYICDCGYQIEESHSLTYEQISEDVHALVCKCGYRREEAHTLSYKRSSDDYHIRVCDCGYSYNEEHTLTYQDYHTDACVCGYTSSTPHNFVYQEGSDKNHHIAICECGYNSEVWHTYVYRSISNSYHSKICPCGYVAAEEAHVFKRVDIRYSACVFCGCIRDNLGPGENVIMGTGENKEKE